MATTRICYSPCGLGRDSTGRLTTLCRDPLLATVTRAQGGLAIDIPNQNAFSPEDSLAELSWTNNTDCAARIITVTQANIAVNACCPCSTPFISLGSRPAGSSSGFGNGLGDRRITDYCGVEPYFGALWVQEHNYPGSRIVGPGETFAREYNFTLSGFRTPCPGETEEECAPKIVEFAYRYSVLLQCFQETE